MISNTTLPGYFDKADLQDTYLDASGDLMLFTQIAAFLQIRVRFAGEEPKDRFTRMYNQNMQRILPRYGIEFVEIPRKEAGEEAISASRVRAAIKDKDIETIRELVPDTTYEFLMKGLSI
jgi:citrate lyase synthetase